MFEDPRQRPTPLTAFLRSVPLVLGVIFSGVALLYRSVDPQSGPARLLLGVGIFAMAAGAVLLGVEIARRKAYREWLGRNGSRDAD